MAYKWKPSKAQKKDFAIKMQNPEFATAYEKTREEKARKKREKSEFDYSSAGGFYLPTKRQYEFCIEYPELFITSQENIARDNIIFGFTCQEKMNHDYIHIVNEKIRSRK